MRLSSLYRHDCAASKSHQGDVAVRHRKSVEEAARTMIERFGFQAVDQTDQRILELQALDESDAVTLWHEIRLCVVEMLGVDASGSTH